MANGRLSANDVELIYPSNNGQRCEWFSIKQDKQFKQVRFLYNTIEDVYFDVVHEVSVNGRTKTIRCLNERGEDVNSCPMCKAAYQQKVSLYIPVLDLSDNKVKIWVRSRAFLPTIQGLMMRNNPLSGTVFEVTRNGVARDPRTTYLVQPISANDGSTVEAILQQMNLALPSATSYMEVYDFNQMQTYVNNLNSIQGNIPANRGGFNQPQQFNNGYNQYGSQAPSGNYQAHQGYTGTPNNQQPNFTGGAMPQTYGQQPQAMPGTYAPQPVSQVPNNVPVRRPATPPPVPTQPMVPPSNPVQPTANSVGATPPPPPNIQPVPNTDDDLPF